MSVRERLDQLVPGRKAVLRGSQTRSRLTPSFSLAKLLDHLPKGSPQGLFPYLATALLLRQHTKVQQSRIIKWLLAKASNQDLPTHPNTDSPLLVSLETHSCKNICCLSWSNPEAAPPASEPQRGGWCSESELSTGKAPPCFLTADPTGQQDASCSCCHPIPIVRSWTPKL